jgi:hypothetical protein
VGGRKRRALALDQVERAADRLEIACAGGGELDTAVEAAEQGDAQLVLEVGDPRRLTADGVRPSARAAAVKLSARPAATKTATDRSEGARAHGPSSAVDRLCG